MRTLTIAALVALTVGQTTPVPLLPNAALEWDPVTLDVNGGPETIAYYTIVNTDDTDSPPNIKKSVDSPGLSVALDPLFTGLAAGNYKLWVQATDTAGNKSGWSVPLDVSWDRAAPQIPAGLRITVP
jgi:hypothetical protein